MLNKEFVDKLRKLTPEELREKCKKIKINIGVFITPLEGEDNNDK